MKLKSGLAVMIFAAMIGVAGSASASAPTQCSNATLNGAYGYSVGGSIYGLPGTEVGQAIFDGQGNISVFETASYYGVTGSGSGTGTYSIATNCTGTLTFDGYTYYVALDEGDKGGQLMWSPGVGLGQYSGPAQAQGSASCSLKKQTFAVNLSGTDVLVGPVAIIGEVTLDGKGNITGTGTFNINGTVTSGTLTGTYTEGSDCLGTAQIVPQGLSIMNLNTVLVDGGKQMMLIETDWYTVVSGILQQ